jgi:hypothetical protein
MDKLLLSIGLIAVLLTGCKKDETPPLSGIVTIDNKRMEGSGTYYILGFTFASAQKVSTLSQPGPDISLVVDRGSGIVTLQTGNFNDSFFKSGEYPDASDAKQAFAALTSFGAVQWTGLAEPLKINQVWLFRTSTNHYAKVRIISITTKDVNGEIEAECAFEWAYQPDGTLTFPGK